jgi:hypothetical protein
MLCVGCSGAEDASNGMLLADGAFTIRDGGILLPDAALITDGSSSVDAQTDMSIPVNTDGGFGDAHVDAEAPDMMPQPALPECGDGVDNDGDGRIDLADNGCTSSMDPRERGDAVTHCSNGLDDDADGRSDFPADPGCSAAGDADETDLADEPACHNARDDDQDGLTDYPVDPGCEGRGDPDETDPRVAPICANGVDDDGDGEIDYPEDTGCEARGDDSEFGQCGPDVEVIDLSSHLSVEPHFDGTTVDAAAQMIGTCGGGAGGEVVFAYRVTEGVQQLVVSTLHPETLSPTVVYVKSRCDAPTDEVCNRGGEMVPGVSLVLTNPRAGLIHIIVDTGARDGGGAFRLTVGVTMEPACRNGIDDDADGRVDNADPGCVAADDDDETDPDEIPACANGVDDDGDGHIDYPADPDCRFAGTDRETPLCPPGAPILNVGQDGGVFELPMAPGAAGTIGSCSPINGPEVILAITLNSPSDVSIEPLEMGMPLNLTMYARTECRDPDSEFACRAVNPGGPLNLETVPRGTFYVVVESNFGPAPDGRTIRVTIESVITECNDEIDNDGDDLIDLRDPGCTRGRDQSEIDPAVLPQCADGIDNDEDELVDYPDDPSCAAAGDEHEGGCDGNPLWRPVECINPAWVWSSNRAFPDLATANENRVLWSGCNHSTDREGLCSLDGTGWVSTETFVMAGCNASWWHIGGRHTGACGGHDGDTIRHLVLNDDECWDYQAAP